MDVVGHIGFFIALCLLLWVGTGLIVSAVDRFARSLKLSPFSLSFFVLGMLTSMPEISVGTNALALGTPEVFVGNLLGGIPVIFLLIIPILAIFGNGVKINHELSPTNILITFAVIVAPSFFVMDKKVTNLEGVVLIGFYLALFVLLEKNKGGILSLFQKHKKSHAKISLLVGLKILAGVLLVFLAARFLFRETMYFAQVMGIPAFYISLIALSLGTNIPELSMAVRSVINGKKDIVLGDYMGSAAANTLLFGVFTLLTPAESFAVNRSMITFGFIVGGLALFYQFYRSKHDISRREGFVLLGVYMVFAFLQFR